MNSQEVKDIITENNFILFTLKSRLEIKDISDMIEKTINKNRSIINELDNQIKEANKVSDKDIREDLIFHGLLDRIEAYTTNSDSIVTQLIKYKIWNKERYYRVLNNVRDFKEKGNTINNINAYLSTSFKKEFEKWKLLA